MEQSAYGVSALWWEASDLTRQMAPEARSDALLRQARNMVLLSRSTSHDPTARQLLSAALAAASLAALLRGSPPAVRHAPPPAPLPPSPPAPSTPATKATVTMQHLQQRLACLTRGLSMSTSPDALSPPSSRLGESYCVLPRESSSSSSSLSRPSPGPTLLDDDKHQSAAAVIAAVTTDAPFREAASKTSLTPRVDASGRLTAAPGADPPWVERAWLEGLAAQHTSVLAEVAQLRRECHAQLGLASAGQRRHESEVAALLERQGQLEAVVRRLVGEKHDLLLRCGAGARGGK